MTMALTKMDENNLPAVYRMTEEDGFEAVPQQLQRYKMDKSGNFINNATEENLGNSIKMAVVGWQKQRILWSEDLGEILCIARDAHNPEIEKELDDDEKANLIEQGAGQYCDSCPLKEFGADGEKPECSETVSIMGYDLDRHVFFTINFSRTQLKNCYTHIGFFINTRLTPFARQTVMSSKQMEKKKFKWFVPVFKLEEDFLPMDFVGRIANERRAVMERVKTMDTSEIIVSDYSEN